jgi:hypothetical protein
VGSAHRLKVCASPIRSPTPAHAVQDGRFDEYKGELPGFKRGAQAWREVPEVISLLTKLLTDATPTIEDLQLARPPGGLSAAHIFELVALSSSGLQHSPPAARVGGPAVVFSRWLAALTINLDDAAAMQALAPATPLAAKALHSRWKRAAAAHDSNLQLFKNRRKVARSRGQCSVAEQAEQDIEAAWRAAEELGAIAEVTTATGGGGDDPPPPPCAAAVSDCERLLALAMGTHPRLGAASQVQKLAIEQDVLRRIGAFMRGAPPPVQPALSELRRLRRPVHAQHVQLMAQTQRACDAEQALELLRRSAGAAERRQAEAARRQLEATRELAVEAAAAERGRAAAAAAELEAHLVEARTALKIERRQAKEATTAAATQAQLARIGVDQRILDRAGGGE